MRPTRRYSDLPRRYSLSLAMIVGVLLFSGLLSGADDPPANAPATPPNIVFIVIDTLRYDHVTANGYGRATTPNLDKLAQSGARFTSMYATSSWTVPSVMSMFTSLPPSLHQVVNYQNQLPNGVTTLAAELKKQGYLTAGFVSNPSASAKFGFGRGFDLYDDYTIPMSGNLKLEDNDQDVTHTIRSISTSADVNRLAGNWLDKRDKTKPFCLFLLYVDCHADYLPPAPNDTLFDPDYKGTMTGKDISDLRNKPVAEADRQHLIALYDGEIRAVDDYVGKLLAKLTADKLDSNTLVVVTGDHGEEFWDHGGMWHGHTLFGELVHVPCIARLPGRIPPGTVLKNQYSQLSLMPTLLSAAGATIPAQCEGPNLWPTLTGKPALADQIVFYETRAEEQDLKAIRSPQAVIIWNNKTDKREAFDLAQDPAQKHGQPTDSSDTFKALNRRFDDWWTLIQEQRKKITDANKAEVNRELIEKLKELGYAQ